MIFLPKNYKLKSLQLNAVADDLVEIANNAANKEAFRLQLINKKLHKLNEFELPLTANIISEITSCMKNKNTSEAELGRILKKLGRGLKSQYYQLSQIFKRLE